MVERIVVWTRNSKIQLQKILEFFKHRNKSSLYGQKLYKKFVAELNKAARQPEIGVKTKLANIRGLIIGDYILFYEILPDSILVLKIWDSRQDPDKQEIPR